jgi:hypothetical protein
MDTNIRPRISVLRILFLLCWPIIFIALYHVDAPLWAYIITFLNLVIFDKISYIAWSTEPIVNKLEEIINRIDTTDE